MKIGDLVKWSATEEIYHLVNSIGHPGLAKVRQRGLVVDKNPKYFFVLWENGDLLAQPYADLEVISESR
jgi:hypothetical protein